MQISCDSRLFKFAYPTQAKRWFPFKPEHPSLPPSTNLCRFFWRVVLLAPLSWFSAYLFVFLVDIPIFSVAFLTGCLAIPFGYRPSFLWKEEEGDCPWRRIKRWPLWLTLRSGRRIFPGFVVLAIVFAFCGWEILKLWRFSFPHYLEGYSPLFWSIVGVEMFVLGLMILYLVWYRAIKDSEFHNLCREWYKAKKQKVCPIIKFVSSESAGEIQTK